jgi:hypothetical protein
MPQLTKQEKVDDLISYFWKNGYLTLSRKFGTYLPEPNNIGQYPVDAVGRLKKKYAIGIILTEDELDDPKIYSKLEFLATRQTKYSQRRITLFIGVPKNLVNKAKLVVNSLSEAAKKSIKIVPTRDEIAIS